ncbi:hypothetical protein [Pseudoclavibacter sp. CFCC 13611]|uniref:hypothetical protein n=1 Tax=Pseudoclavibacter sp. CFCC 13611 TaxID=2615178 RepID=UPI0013010961|nr:hypothetical protein [Pseudoclavibacter sp. CFCC 13611]KAB1662929.1 hypothetical protein F8O08_10270 [Pseudoclavibacter sp. CFCC 13611]
MTTTKRKTLVADGAATPDVTPEGQQDPTPSKEQNLMTTVYRVTDWADAVHFGTAEQIVGRAGAKFGRENNYWRAVAPNPHEDTIDILDRYRDVTIHACHEDYWMQALTGWRWELRGDGSICLYQEINETFGYEFTVLLTEDKRVIAGMECPSSWDFDNGSELEGMANAYTDLAEWLDWQGTALDAIKAVFEGADHE